MIVSAGGMGATAPITTFSRRAEADQPFTAFNPSRLLSRTAAKHGSINHL
jgi:hypothetical protein